jgi:hypothetical protein
MTAITSISNFLGGVSQQPPMMRFQNQCAEQINAVASPVEGLTKRPPTEHLKNLVDGSGNQLSYSSLFVHTIDRSANERYFAVFGRNDNTSSAFVHVYDINGNRIATNIDSPALDYINEAGVDSKLKAMTIGDVTFVVNTNKVVTTNATVSKYSRNTTSQQFEALVWITQTNYKRTHGITINTVTIQHETSQQQTDDIGTDHIAAQLETAFNTAKAALTGGNPTYPTIQGITVVRYASVVFFYRTSGTNPMDISVFDDFGGSAITLIKDEVRSFDMLPPVAPHLMKIKIAGSPESPADDYWVEFIQSQSSPTTTAPRAGLWFETVGPGLITELNPATMPHILIRESNGQFRFRQANGAASYPDYKWATRIVGDDLTNPTPTFVDQKINEISLYQNRLLFLSGENVIFSETSRFFNFWRTTVVDSVAADTIDVASTNPKVANLQSATSFEGQLILFSQTSQFSVSSNGPLTPTSITMLSVGDYENTSAEPVATGRSLFFAFNRGGFSGVREMALGNRIESRFEAEDMSASIPQYIPGSIRQMVASTHENYLIARSDGDRSSLYVYKYFQIGDQRVQSSWSKFSLTTSSNVPHPALQIQHIAFIDAVLYIIVQRGNATSLEMMRLESGRVDTGSTYITTLDRRLDLTKLLALGGAASYNSATDLTTYTLPYQITTGSSFQVISDSGRDFGATQTSSTTVTVPGNRAGVAVWLGEKYKMTYILSEPLFRSSNEGSMSAIGGRYQIRYATLSFGKTSYFKAKVSVEYGNTYEYDFTARFLGSGNNIIGSFPPLETGSYRIPAYCKSTGLTITIENDTALPSNLISMEYEASFNERGQRV